MNDSDVYHLEELAQEFVERLRHGEKPSLEDFVSRCPEHADEIRELFPALQVMENAVLDKHFDSSDSSRIADPIELLSVPFDLGDYHVLRELGRGGMGVVYEAEQQALGRRVALKVLSGAAAKKPNSLVRFQREARSAGRLHHTNIVPVFDTGCEKGTYFYTMQLIEGESLDHVIVQLSRLRSRDGLSDLELDRPKFDSATGIAESLLQHDFLTAGSSSTGAKVSIADATSRSSKRATGIATPGPPQTGSDLLLIRNIARIGLQVAEALAYAHGQKILHRDVKPANLILDVHGIVWITDFGLARDQEQNLTATGDLVGTLRYMAPERFRGTVDARGDVYSLGLTLYEMLTLRSCLPRSNRSMPIRLDGPRLLPSLRDCNSAIPRDLETIVLKAMEHEPQQRYAKAEDLAEDLRRFLSDRPILARPVTTIERTWMWILRNPRESTWLVALAFAFAILTAGGLFTFFLREERDRARREERNAIVARKEATLAEREANLRGLLSQAIVQQKSGQPGSRGKALERIHEAAALNPFGEIRQELQRSAIIALSTQDVRFERVSGKFDFAGTFIAFDLGNRYLANATDGAIVLRNAEDFSELSRIQGEHFTKNTSLLFSKNAKYLVVDADGVTSVYRIDNAESVFVSQKDDCISCDLSPDERYLALSYRSRRIDLVDLTDTSDVKLTTDLDQPATRVAFSPDGKQILLGYLSGDKRPEIFDRKTLKRTHALSRAPHSVMALAWHPDGRRVALSTGQSVEIWDVAKGQRLRQLLGHWQTVDQVEFHPTLPLLRTSSWDGMSRLWDITAGHLIATFVKTNSASGWDRDGTMLGCAVASDHVDIVRPEPMNILRHMDPDLLEPRRPYLDSRASTGRLQGRLVTSTNRRGIVFCNTHTGRTLASMQPINPCLAQLDRNGDCLWVASQEGLSKLPIHVENDEAIVGPPDHHEFFNDWYAAEISKNEDVFAAINTKSEVLEVWDLRFWNDRPTRTDEKGRISMPTELGLKRFASPITRYHDALAVSPDGRWAATSYWHDETVLVWDLQEGKIASELVFGKHIFLAFSADSKSLMTCRSDAMRAYQVQTWKPTYSIPRSGCALPGRMAFSYDGNFVACEIEPGIVGLIELATQEVLLRLQLPNQPSSIFWLEFSRDDSHLHMATYEPSQVSDWNLRNVRDELHDLGLDWDERLDLLLKNASDPVAPQGDLSLRLVGVDAWQAPPSIARMSKAQANRTISIAENAFARKPDSPNAAANLARLLLMAPESRDPRRANELAQFAIKQSPFDPASINVLGLSQLRLGDAVEASETIEKQLKLQSDTTLPFALYILAISMCSQGRVEEAKTYLAWAEQAEVACLYSSEEENADREAIAEEARTILSETAS